MFILYMYVVCVCVCVIVIYFTAASNTAGYVE